MSVRSWRLFVPFAAGAVVVLGALTVGPFDVVTAAGLPGGLGPCLGPECPESYPPGGGGIGPIIGRDDNVAVFAGGDYSVIGGAAEAEGRVIVMGDFSQSKTGPGTYNVGAVGAGLQVPPPEGSTFLAVRGHTSVDADDRLTAIKPDPDGAAGDIRGVSRDASGIIEGQEVVFDPSQIAETDPYVGLADELTAASECYAEQAATGTLTSVGTTVIFTGDGTSALQVFTVTDDIGSVNSPAGIQFTGIPAGATVLVNVVPVGTTWSATTSFDAGGWEAVARTLLWNVPFATNVSIGRPVQWFGSTLIGNQASTATVTTSGYNGRFYATGNIVHGSTTTSGEEFHSLPFDGDLPDCLTPPTTSTTSTTSTTTTTTTPTTSSSTTTSTSTTTTTSSSTTTSTTTSTSTTTTIAAGLGGVTSTSAAGGAGGPSTTGPNGGLPTTGMRHARSLLGIAALSTCAGLAMIAARRRTTI